MTFDEFNDTEFTVDTGAAANAPAANDKDRRDQARLDGGAAATAAGAIQTVEATPADGDTADLPTPSDAPAEALIAPSQDADTSESEDILAQDETVDVDEDGQELSDEEMTLLADAAAQEAEEEAALLMLSQAPASDDGETDAAAAASMMFELTQEYDAAPPVDYGHANVCGCPGCGRDRSQDGAAEDGSGSGSGSPSAPTANGTIQDFSNYLRTGWWDDAYGWSGTRYFNMTDSGTGANDGSLYFNLTNMTSRVTPWGTYSDSNGVASHLREDIRDALDILEEALGINFIETTSTGGHVDLFFFDNDSGNWAGPETHASNNSGPIDYSVVHLPGSSTGPGDGYFTTILHEIGHAMGLGHAGDYNSTVNFNTDAEYLNDSDQMTVMSYLSQGANPNITASSVTPITYQMADYEALNDLYASQGYGTSNAFNGNTKFGFGTNLTAAAAHAYFDLSTRYDNNAFTLVDGSGNDTIDVSNWNADQNINLAVTTANSIGVFSDVGGLTGNMGIAVGTVIEDAYAGGGDDTVRGNSSANELRGNGGDDTLYGYDGNDTLEGGAGDDRMYGGDDNDTFVYRDGGTDGQGDTVYGSSGDDRLMIRGTAGTTDLRGIQINSIEEIQFYADGSNNDKVLILDNVELDTSTEFSPTLLIDGNNSGGSTERIQIEIGSSNLDISGWTFQDWGGQNERVDVNGGSGAQTIDTTSEDDSISAGGGNDTINSGAGDDTVRGEDGDDSIIAGAGNDWIYAGDGDDTVDGGLSGSNAGSGEDRIYGGDGSDYLDSDDGDDTIYGASSASGYSVDTTQSDTIFSDEGNDFVYGSDGDDSINGGADDDWLLGNNGDDTIIGGTGEDTVSYLYAQGSVSVDLAAGTATGADGTDTISSVEHITGSLSYGDLLVGDSGANTIVGSGGNDTIDGGAGVDYVDAGGNDDVVRHFNSGGDNYDGGSGNDTLEYSVGLGSGAEIDLEAGTYSFNGTAYFDYLNFENYHRTNVASVSSESVLGTAGDNSIIVGGGANLIDGRYGDDTIQGNGGNDTIDGGAGADSIDGGAGDDSIDGGANDDSINGGDDDDTLDGGLGIDHVEGGAGNDVIRHFNGGGDNYYGGSGNDTLEYSVGLSAVAEIDLEAGTYSANGNPLYDYADFENYHRVNITSVSSETVLGTSGDNSIIVGAGANLVDGRDGSDTIYANAGNDTVNDGDGKDAVYLGDGNDRLMVGDSVMNGDGYDGGNNTDTFDLTAYTWAGGSGAYVDLQAGLWSSDGNDTEAVLNFENIEGGDGAGEVLIGSNSGSVIAGYGGDDTILGGDGDDKLLGGDGDDYIADGAGQDVVDGGDGDDWIAIGDDASNNGDQYNGGDDDDVFDISGLSLAAGATVDLSINSWTTGVGSEAVLNFENIIGSGGAGDLLRGNAFGNEIGARDGDDSVEGGGGNDTLLGEAGDDSLDGGADHDLLQGGIGNDTLLGGTGDDTLIGGADADTLQGGQGHDIYIVDDNLDTIIELAGEGYDTMQSDLLDVILVDHVDDIVLQGSLDLNGTGNGLANIIDGNDGDNLLDGGTGGDTINGGAGNDTLLGGAGDGWDHLNGGDGADLLVGTGGRDQLSGDAGADTMQGGWGNDTYYVDNWNDVVEDGNSAAAGYDHVYASAGHQLTAFVEELTLVGSGNILGHGNGLGNTITGNVGNNNINARAGADTVMSGGGDDVVNAGSGADSVEGGGGNDELAGASGNDTLLGGWGDDTLLGGAGSDSLLGEGGVDSLIGGNGHDTLDGGVGADVHQGGSGDDVYYVDNIFDVVSEGAGGGDDFVFASADFILASYVENLTLVGTDNLTGTGNGVANTLVGNSGDNMLLGLFGADSLEGGSGSDTLDGGGSNDTIDGGLGGDVIIGGAGDDSLSGGAGGGWDQVTGGVGNDVVSTGAGNDDILFYDGDDSDTIVDFALGSDQLYLDEALWGGGKSTGDVIADHASVSFGNTILDFGDDSVLLVGVTNLTLLEADLAFL